jgi:VIT1/CCC1 family predicted Fe2+/Mn2+ transporter
MRVSNGIALVMLFAGGFALARYSGLRPVLTGLSYTAIGILLVLMTMALGG